MWNSNSNSPLIPWSVNLFLRYKSSIFCNVHLKWYISHSFKGWRRFMLWELTKIRSILRPYISDFLLTTTSFNPSWIIMNEMGVSSHKGSIQVIQAWNVLVYISRDCFVYTYWLEASLCSSLKTISKMRNVEFQHLFFITITLLRLDRSVLLL